MLLRHDLLTGAEQGESGRAAPQVSGVDDEVTGAGTAAQNRRPALEVTQDRDGHDQRVASTEVTADDTGPAGLTALSQAQGEVPYPAHRRGRRHDEADDEGDRSGSHGCGVGEVLGCGPCTDVAARGPLGAEVVPLNQDVSAHRRARIGEGQDRAVVPGSDRRLRSTRQERRDDGEKLLLAEVTDPLDARVGSGRLSD